MTLRDFLNILFLRKWILLFLFATFVGGLVFAAKAWPKTYRSSASLYLMSKRETIDQSLVDNPTINRGISLLLPDVLSEVELVRSAGVRAMVVKELDLETQVVNEGDVLLAPELQRRVWDAYLYENMTAEAATNANVILVTFTDSQAERAARIVSSFADSYCEFRRKLAEDRGSIERLNAEEEKVQGLLREAEQALSQFDAEWKLVETEAQKTELIGLQARTRSQVGDERSALLRAQADLRDFQDALSGDAARLGEFSDVRNNQTYQNYETRLSDLQIELAAVSQHNLDDSDAVQRIREDIANVTAERESKAKAILQSIAFEKQTLVDSLAAGLVVRDELLASIESELDVLRSRSLERDHLAIDLEILQDHNKMVHRRLSQAQFDQMMGGTGNIDVVVAGRGNVPQRPYFPPPFWISAVVAVITGALVSFSCVLVLDVLDQSMKTADEVERLLGVEVLGSVPKRMRPSLLRVLES